MTSALLWSAGLDSTLLLAMLLEAGEEFTIIQFRDGWNKAQRARADKVIMERNLQVFSYPASYLTVMGDDEQKSVVFDMAVGGTTIPVVRDLIDGDGCLAELDGLTMHQAPTEFDKYYVGTRREDRHYTLPPFEHDTWQVGRATFVAPLFDLTRDEVITLANHYKIDTTPVDETADSNDIHLCHNCLKAVEGEVYCPQAGHAIPAMGGNLQLNLTEFRKRFITVC